MTFDKIHTAQDLLEVLRLLSHEHDLDAVYLKTCGKDDVLAIELREETLTDGSKVYDLHFLR
jgi:hypothetical protein